MPDKIEIVYQTLLDLYPKGECALCWQGNPYRLLVMGILSAQCTDEKVNRVSESLFEKYPTPDALKVADYDEVESILHPMGLSKTKAKNIMATAKVLVETYNGIVPDTMEALLTLPGVGRKVGNLLLGDLYHIGGVVADTHCIRICARLGFYDENEKSPLVCEKVMGEALTGKDISAFCHRIVFFGRDICTARSPKCTTCPLNEVCSFAKKTDEKAKIIPNA